MPVLALLLAWLPVQEGETLSEPSLTSEILQMH